MGILYYFDMRRYFLPVLSGVLLALALYPFALWPLALVALAPLFYFLSDYFNFFIRVFIWSQPGAFFDAGLFFGS